MTQVFEAKDGLEVETKPVGNKMQTIARVDGYGEVPAEISDELDSGIVWELGSDGKKAFPAYAIIHALL